MYSTEDATSLDFAGGISNMTAVQQSDYAFFQYRQPHFGRQVLKIGLLK